MSGSDGRRRPRATALVPGAQYGDWTVVSGPIVKLVGADKKPRGFHLCRCACGVEREVRTPSLVAGRTPNCGHGSLHLRARPNDPFITLLVEAMRARNVPATALAKASGVSLHQIHKWLKEGRPNAYLIGCCYEALGYSIALVPLQEHAS